MLERAPTVILVILLISTPLIPLFIPSIALPYYVQGNTEKTFTPGSMLFVGDIMLGRHVETLMDSSGDQYPLKQVKNILSSTNFTVGNFEGTIPKEHTHTEDYTMQFSIQEKSMHILAQAGFDALSLANNHSYDYGKEAFDYTQSVCVNAGLICAGNPVETSSSSLSIFSVGDTRVGVLFLYGVGMTKDHIDNFDKIITQAKNESDTQIAFIHWGTEYETKHTDIQSALAHHLIDHGIDAVMGHHPHVVEDIEIYTGKPIFYSLGNFVFDQYFSDTVQKGLGIKIDFNRDNTTYTLVPFSSIETPSQPHLMDIEDKTKFLSTILPPYDPDNVAIVTDSKIILGK